VRPATASTETVRASFEVSYVIAKYKKLHTIGETLLLLAAMKICEIMDGEKTFSLITIPEIVPCNSAYDWCKTVYGARDFLYFSDAARKNLGNRCR
jgi:hypothetical protein